MGYVDFQLSDLCVELCNFNLLRDFNLFTVLEESPVFVLKLINHFQVLSSHVLKFKLIFQFSILKSQI